MKGVEEVRVQTGILEQKGFPTKRSNTYQFGGKFL